MKRFELVTVSAATATEAIRPNVTGSYQVLDYGPGRNRVLVLRVVPDGTPAGVNTIADLSADGLDVSVETLSAAQITAIKTRLTNAGIDISQFDADDVGDRRKLLRFLLRRWLGWRAQDLDDMIHIRGFDVV